MGAWGHAAWDNDAAADWFGDVFEGLDLDSKIEAALRYDDHDDDKVRAAAYLLQVLGIRSWGSPTFGLAISRAWTRT